MIYVINNFILIYKVLITWVKHVCISKIRQIKNNKLNIAFVLLCLFLAMKHLLKSTKKLQNTVSSQISNLWGWTPAIFFLCSLSQFIRYSYISYCISYSKWICNFAINLHVSSVGWSIRCVGWLVCLS